MRKKIKKITNVIVAIIMIVTMVPIISYSISANEESYSGKCGENVAWNLDVVTGTLTISGSGTMNDMPDEWDDTSAYKKYKESIKEIVIEKGITSIGNFAFNQCTEVEKVTLPDGMLSIGNNAFWNCASLTNINLPEGVKRIGEGAFGYCSELKELAIPDSITKIEARTFYACGLNNITLPDTVTYIGDEAFRWCSLEHINIPEGLAEIGYNIFNMCLTLTSISVDEKNANFCSVDGVMYSKDKTILYKYPAAKTDKEFAMPKEVKNIEDGAIESVKSIEKITITDGVELIGSYMFYNCQSLKEVYISKSVKHLEEDMCIECPVLEAINVDEANDMYSSEKGILFDKEKRTLIKYPNNSNETNYAVPGTVKIIGAHAFYYSNVKQITIPQGVEIIGKWSFASCIKLNEIEIPSSVKEINVFALYNSADIVKILNPNCKIIDYDEMGDNSGNTIEGIIYGYANSTAETFARKYYREFRDIVTGEVIYNPNSEDSPYGWKSYFGFNEDWYEGAEGELIEAAKDSWIVNLDMLGYGGILGAHISKSLEMNLVSGKKYTIKCNLKSTDCDKWIFIALKQEENYAYGKWIKVEKGVEKSIKETFIAQTDADEVCFGIGGEYKGGASSFSREIYSFLDGGAEALDDEDCMELTQIQCRNWRLDSVQENVTPVATTTTEDKTKKSLDEKTSKKQTKNTTIKKTPVKTRKSSKIKLSLKKVTGAKKYEIQIAKDKKFKKIIVKKIVKKINVTITSRTLKNKKVLYVRVRVKGCKEWSKIKKIRIKK